MAVLADVHITIESLNDADEWQTCKEYQPTIEKTISTSTSWIESIDRQRFRIKWKCQRADTPHGHWMDCRVDGTLVQGLAIDADNVEQGIEHVLEGHQSTDALMRPFSFTTLRTTEEVELVNQTQAAIDSVGSIRIDVGRADFLGPDEESRGLPWDEPIEYTFLEGTKKAVIPHSVAFGAPVQSLVTFCSPLYVDALDKPQYTFIFKYRSMDVLKATRIVADPDARIATPAYVSLLEDADSPVPSFPLTPPFYEYEGNHRIYDVDGSDAWHAPTPRQSPQIPLPRTTPQAPAQVIDVRKRVRMQSKLVGPVVKMEPREPRLPPSTAGMTIDLTQDDD